MSSNGIAHLSTKEDRQKAKLDLAATDRAASGRRPYYDITELPTQYSGNTIIDNPNIGGLMDGRPWRSTPLISYTIGTIPSSINEGSAGTINVTTTGIADGTTLYWTVNNVTTSNADFGTLSGSFTVTSNAGSFTVTPTADNLTEGAETFTVQIRTGSTSGTVVATTSSVTVNDTSTTPTFVATSLLSNLLTAPTSGTTWIDVSGGNRNGTVRTSGTGTATYTSANGGGLILGPSNAANMAMISMGVALPTTNWTVEMVVDTQPTGYWATLFGSENYNSQYGHLMYWAFNTGNTAVAVGAPGRTSNYTATNLPATVSGPRHIVVSVGTGTLNLYVNGTLITPFSSTYATPAAQGGTLNFGSRHPNAGTNYTPFDCLPGTYYQMRVYNKALSQAEVTQNYTASKAYTSGLP